MTRTLPRVLMFLLIGELAAAGAVAGAEPTFETFEEVCLNTANQRDQISEKMEKLNGWKPVSPEDRRVLMELDNNQTWHLQSDMELGIVVSGSIPLAAGNWAGVDLCMFVMPRHALTIENASEFLLQLGGLPAQPIGKGGDDNDVFFAHLLDGNWMVVGTHVLPSGTHLQFLLMDVSDELAKAAIEKAKSK